MCRRLIERKASVGQSWKGKVGRAKSEGQDRLAMTRRDRVTQGQAATFMLGDGVYIFDQSTRSDFPQPTTPCFGVAGVHIVLQRA